jgi:hypothetical protein
MLADKVTDIGGDNVACLCWLGKQKATKFLANRLLKLKNYEPTIISIPSPVNRS